MNAVFSPRPLAAGLTELWSPRVIGEENDAYVKVAKVQGSLAWHEGEDELFLVLKGRLRIEPEAGPVELGEVKAKAQNAGGRKAREPYRWMVNRPHRCIWRFCPFFLSTQCAPSRPFRPRDQP